MGKHKNKNTLADNTDRETNQKANENARRIREEEIQYVKNLVEQNKQLVASVNADKTQITELSTRVQQLLSINQNQTKEIEELKEENQNLKNLLSSLKENLSHQQPVNSPRLFRK